MKFIFALLLLTTSAFAQELSEKVLIEHATHVGFAPARHRGTFRFQILNSGVIQKIDNKNAATTLGKLSADLTAKLSKAVNDIKDVDLKDPNGPRCMDAPSSDLKVRQSNGVTLTLWKRAGCRETTAKDETLNDLVKTLMDLRSSVSSIDNF